MSQPQSGPPPHAVVLQMLLGKMVSHAVSAAACLGVADYVDAGPKSAEELAALTKSHAPSLYRLLRALASVGVFTELEDGRFAHTALSQPLSSAARPSVRNLAMMMIDDWHMKTWTELEWSVRTGQPAPFKVFGMHGFEWFTQHPEEAVNFNNAMTDMSQADAPGIAASYDFSGFGHIVDVAGGMGTLLASILERTPGLRGTLFEMPYLVDQVRASPILAPYRDRCDVVGGDFFQSVPAADAYVMKFIIHDWDDEKAAAILRSCRAAIRPGGKLLVVDQVVGPRNEPGLAKIMDLEMLVAPGGMERTEEQFRALFTRAGFRLDRVIPTPAPHRIIEGSPV